MRRWGSRTKERLFARIGCVCDLDDGVIWIAFQQPEYVEWQQEAGFSAWNLYRGDLEVLRSAMVYTQDPGVVPLAARYCGLTDPWVADLDPLPGEGVFFLTTGIYEGTTTESGLGTDSAGYDRPNTNPCP